MLKKTLLLASAAMALAAFAVPAAAQANQWYTDIAGSSIPVGSTTATGAQVTLTGDLSTTAGPGFAFRSGPCKVDATATLWNNGGQATGEVTAFTITTPCGTSIPGCTIEKAKATTSFPWHITVTGDAIAIAGAGFGNEYDDGCTVPYGIPPTVLLGGTGTATGTFNTTSDCIDFVNAGDLSGGLGPLQIDGSVCNTDGSTLTLK